MSGRQMLIHSGLSGTKGGKGSSHDVRGFQKCTAAGCFFRDFTWRSDENMSWAGALECPKILVHPTPQTASKQWVNYALISDFGQNRDFRA